MADAFLALICSDEPQWFHDTSSGFYPFILTRCSDSVISIFVNILMIFICITSEQQEHQKYDMRLIIGRRYTVSFRLIFIIMCFYNSLFPLVSILVKYFNFMWPDFHLYPYENLNISSLMEVFAQGTFTVVFLRSSFVQDMIYVVKISWSLHICIFISRYLVLQRYLVYYSTKNTDVELLPTIIIKYLYPITSILWLIFTLCERCIYSNVGSVKIEATEDFLLLEEHDPTAISTARSTTSRSNNNKKIAGGATTTGICDVNEAMVREQDISDKYNWAVSDIHAGFIENSVGNQGRLNQTHNFILSYWREHKNLLRRAQNLARKTQDETQNKHEDSTIKNGIGLHSSDMNSDGLNSDDQRQVQRRLFTEFLNSEHKYTIPGTICSLLLTVAEFAGPYFLGCAFDAALKPGISMREVLPYLYGVMLAQLVCFVLNVTIGILFAMANHNLTMKMRKRLFHSILTQEVAFFDQEQAGVLSSRLMNDASAMQTMLNQTLKDFLTACSNFVGGLVAMCLCEWHLSLLSTLIAPVVLRVIHRIGLVVSYYSLIQQDTIASANATSTECVTNIRTVKSMAGEIAEEHRYRLQIDYYLKVIFHSLFSETILRFMSTFINNAIDGVVSVMGFYLILSPLSRFSIGQFVAFNSYRLKYTTGLDSLTSIWVSLQSTVGTSRRFFELLDRVPRIYKSEGTLRPILNGKIAFKNVTFQYPSRQQMVLRDISFEVSPGEVYALVGASGAGKSTCVKLLERFYDPVDGRISIDGYDVKDIDINWLRCNIGYVSQDPVLFNRTIVENIIFGVYPPPTKKDIEDAARIANAHDFIEELSDGYLTTVGEQGIMLSGGQKQRIAIARAVVRNPRILILDEATSSLDAASEHLVQEALNRVMVGRSTIVIAHRLSTIKSATCILVLKDGLIYEKGTHDDLIEKEGIYQEFIRYQMLSNTVCE